MEFTCFYHVIFLVTIITLKDYTSVSFTQLQVRELPILLKIKEIFFLQLSLRENIHIKNLSLNNNTRIEEKL